MRFFFSIGLAMLTVAVFAQSRDKLYFSASVNPVISMAINTSSSNKLTGSTPPQTLAQYQDSVRSFESYKLSLGATVWVNYALNSKWTLQSGIGYSEIGFTRQQKNIQFNDRLYPGIGSKGKLLEISNSTKNVDYRFRYQYITVPVLFNYYAKRSGDFKWTYYFTGGIGLNMLVKHEMKAVLDQFVVEGENVFHIDSTGYEGRFFTVNVFAGGRIDYKVDKNMSVFAQPMLTIFPMSVSKTDMHSYPIGLQVNLGVSYVFDKKKDE
ncbi:MAG: outer membrane beta-barrel protein [Bacteroidota bacterium]